MRAETSISHATQGRWIRGHTLINLRADPTNAELCQAIGSVVNLEWPLPTCTTRTSGPHRGLWAGPDDAFVLGPASVRNDWLTRLREAAAGHHAAVTDVSSGYGVLQLRGESVRDLLAQGCPMDLHPRAFKPGDCVGTNFFKASVWLWQTDQDEFQLLVRSSFAGYVQSLLDKCALDEPLHWS